MSSRMLLEYDHTHGKGLGIRAQGITKPIKAFKGIKRRGLGYHENYEGRGNQGSCKGRGGQLGSGEGHQGLLLPELSDIFLGPSKLLQEEEGAIIGIIELFEGDLICTIASGEEVESSTSPTKPFE